MNFLDPVSGPYTIDAAYMYNATEGAAPYNMMILQNPKRLGQATQYDNGSAAKVAGMTFVADMNKNQVGVVWFNDSQPMAPTTSFVGNPVSGNAPLTVAFTDLSTNAPSSWAWNFGDSQTDTTKNPSHTYNTPGTYTVSLTATNDGGSNTFTRTNYILVHNAAPTAGLQLTR